LRKPESGTEVRMDSHTSNGASPSDSVEGKRKPREVGPADGADGQKEVKHSGRVVFVEE
jgi:hypothetical protein